MDVRNSAIWALVQEHFEKLHDPVLGQPHQLLDIASSTDGRRVALTGMVYDKLLGLPRQAVYEVRDGALRALTTLSGCSRSPKFSPDGTTLAFLSDQARTGQFQLMLLRPGAFEEPHAAAAVYGTVEYLHFSPDGTHILLGVAGLGADIAGGQGSGTTVADDPGLPDWHPRIDTGVTEQSWRSLWLYNVEADALRRLSPDRTNVWEANWLGLRAIAAVVSPSPDEGAWYTAELAELDLTGKTRRLYTPKHQLGWPSAAPDGSRLAVVEAICSDRWVVAGDLLIGMPGEPLEPVDTNGVDVTSTQWIDGDLLGLIGLRGLETVAAIHDIRTGKTTEVWSSIDTSCGWSHPEGAWTASGDLVIIEEGYALPQQVVVHDGTPRVLLQNAHAGTEYLRAVAGGARPVAWSAPDGLRIEGLLCTPDREGPFPLVINIHGGPVWSFRSLWSMYYPWTPLLVAAGYAVLNPNPRGSSGRGQAFASLVFGEMGGDDTWDFTSAVDALADDGIIDPDRIGLIGGSYGGYMSSWLVTQDPRWAAAVPTSPVTNWYSQHFTSNIPHFDALFLDGNPAGPGDKYHRRSPVVHARNVKTPCLNVAGALDRCTPPTQAQEFHQALLEHGVPSALAIYPQEAHGVRAFPALIDYCTRILTWFDRYMPAAGPAATSTKEIWRSWVSRMSTSNNPSSA